MAVRGRRMPMTASTSASAGAGHAAVTVTVRSPAEDEDAEKIDEKTGDGNRHQTIRVDFRWVCEMEDGAGRIRGKENVLNSSTDNIFIL